MKKIRSSWSGSTILRWTKSLFGLLILLLFQSSLSAQQIERFIRLVAPPAESPDVLVVPYPEKSGLSERSNIKSIYISDRGDSIIILTKDQGAFITSNAGKEQVFPFLKEELKNKEALQLLSIGEGLYALLDYSEMIPIVERANVAIPIKRLSTVDIALHGDKMFVATRSSGVYIFSYEQNAGWISERQLTAEKADLPSDRVLDLLVASNGVLWIGTDSGLAAYYEGTVVNYAPPIKKKKGVPAPENKPKILFRHESNKILEYGKDRIYVGGKSGVFSVGTQQANIDHVLKLPIPYDFRMVNDLCLEGATKLWIAGDHLIKYQIFDNIVIDYNLADSLYKSERAYCLALNSASNEMWVGTTGSGVFIVPLYLPHIEEPRGEVPGPNISNDTIFFSKSKNDYLPVDQFFIMREVQFGEDDYQLTAEGVRYLNGLVNKIKRAGDQYRIKDIVIRGHTSKDRRGNEDGNRKLSQYRADAVKQFLVDRGIPEETVYAKGYGNEEPNPLFSDNLYHHAHRRVEMKIALISKKRQ